MAFVFSFMLLCVTWFSRHPARNSTKAADPTNGSAAFVSLHS